MKSLDVDCGHARVAVAAAAHRVALLLEHDIDTERGVPGLAWTVGETVAHVVTETQSFARLASGELTPEELWDSYAPGLDDRPQNERIAALNAATIASFDRNNLARAGELVETAVDKFVSSTADWPPDVLFRGVEGDIEVATATCVMLGELLIHGRDLAGAIGKQWAIPPDEAALVLSGAASLLPDYLDAAEAGDLKATIDVRVRGGPRFAISIHDGCLEVAARPTGRVDCHVSANPVAFLLVAYGRQSQWTAALRGHLLAWGRRPWVALRLPRLLTTP